MLLIWGMYHWVSILSSGLADLNMTNLYKSMELSRVEYGEFIF